VCVITILSTAAVFGVSQVLLSPSLLTALKRDLPTSKETYRHLSKGSNLLPRTYDTAALSVR
jgi:hypothetical protein